MPESMQDIQAAAVAAQKQAILANMEARRQQLVDQNVATFQRLSSRGVEMFDPLSVLSGRIDQLIETLSRTMDPQGETLNGHMFRLQALLDWEEAMARNLGSLEETGMQNKLAEGGSFTPGMIAQLAKATNTFGPPRNW